MTVAVGEYLGVVGSSGSSTAPHLHFEVWAGYTASTLIDPYAGACNIFNDTTWWVSQKPYTEPAIVEASVHPALAVFPACPETETPNEDTVYAGGGTARFYIFMRNETIGMVESLRIVNPGGTTFDSWTRTSIHTYLSSYWIWTRSMPTIAGTYTFEARYNGTICTKAFRITGSISVGEPREPVSTLKVYPSPSDGKIVIELGDANRATVEGTIEIYDVLGKKIVRSALADSRSELTLDAPPGVYFYRVKGDGFISTGKLIIK
jgi:hypothetical protein